MKRLDSAIETIHLLDDLAAENTVLTRLSPLVKLVGIFCFLVTLASFDQMALPGVVFLLLYLPVLYRVGQIPWKPVLRQMKPVLILIGGIGLVNIFFLQAPPIVWGSLHIPAGAAAFVVLCGKACGCVLAAYVVLATTSLEKLAAALQKLPLPRLLTVSLLLTWRYLVLLLQEGRRMATSYQLRAPESRGIPWRIGGSLLGLLFLRSLDRAELVYESMELRGFDGRFPDAGRSNFSGNDVVFLLGTASWCLICRFFIEGL
jgi:cobalt/nickel transport system permease protein